MASSPPWFYSSSPRSIRHRTTNSVSKGNATSSCSKSCSPSPFSSHPNSSYQRGQCWNFITFSGIKFIWKHKSLKAQAATTTQGNLSSPTAMINVEEKPDHLIVLVHGIMGSPSDWTFCEAELKSRLGKKFLIYASSCNMYTKTFTGIDGSGKRLADEVSDAGCEEDRELNKDILLAHSLGGLIARYAVAVLYSQNVSSDHPNDTAASTAASFKTSCSLNCGLIAGLEAINFITLATPHLGVRGKAASISSGCDFLGENCSVIAPIFTGRTGSQLFLTDGNADKPPLLLQMASDCDEGKFMSGQSALAAFKRRVLYANVSYDHMVGWRTSSIRRETELVKYCPPVLSERPQFPPEAAKAKEAAQNEPSAENTLEYHEIMEEEMIHGLQRLGWMKVDVSFHSAFWPFFAHYSIQVKMKGCIMMEQQWLLTSLIP